MILRDAPPGTRFTIADAPGEVFVLTRPIEGGAVAWCTHVDDPHHSAVVSLGRDVTIVGTTETHPRYGTRVPKGPSGERTPRNAYGGDQPEPKDLSPMIEVGLFVFLALVGAVAMIGWLALSRGLMAAMAALLTLVCGFAAWAGARAETREPPGGNPRARY